MAPLFEIMTTFLLKILAVITMIIDHVGAIFFPQAIWLRFIGRIAFPIYAFLLVQGFLHTKDTPRFKKYLGRMIIFTFLSEVSFDLCFSQKPLYLDLQNVYFTLCLGLCALYFYEWLESKNKDGFYSILLFSVIAFLLKTDYNFIGIIFIFTFYFTEKWKKENKNITFRKMYLIGMYTILIILEIIMNSYALTLNAIITSFTQYTWAYLGTFLTIIPISMYNGKLGYKTKASQLFFYFAYPAHLTIIYLIYRILMNS